MYVRQGSEIEVRVLRHSRTGLPFLSWAISYSISYFHAGGVLMPKDSEGKTLGYAFIEYNTPQVIIDPGIHTITSQNAQEGRRLEVNDLIHVWTCMKRTGPWRSHARGVALHQNFEQSTANEAGRIYAGGVWTRACSRGPSHCKGVLRKDPHLHSLLSRRLRTRRSRPTSTGWTRTTPSPSACTMTSRSTAGSRKSTRSPRRSPTWPG